MKSPNSTQSMKLLKTAIEAVRTAREDLKNDPRVRLSTQEFSTSLSGKMTELERDLEAIKQALKLLGY